VGVEHAGQRFATGHRTIDGGGILEGHVDEWQAGTGDLDRHVGKQVGDPEPKSRSHILSLLDHLAKLGRRMRHPEDDRFPSSIDPHRYRTDTLLEREGRGIGADQSFIEEHPAGADRWMAGERQLDMRREDPHLRGMLSLLRWQDERRLREIRLPGDGLHLRRR